MVIHPVAIAVLFPGQGTQTLRMGEPWRACPAWEIAERAEKALGQPLAHLLLEAATARAGDLGVHEVGPGNVLTGLAKPTLDAPVTLRSVTVPTDALQEVA